MASKIGKAGSEIVAAAEALEDELADLEAIARGAGKIRLNSEKNLARATAELNRTLALPERLAERLQAVAAALAGMQQRQQAALEPLAALATQVQQRAQLLGEHMQSFGALGQAAAEVNALLGASQEDRSGLGQAEARLREISEAARTLFEAARADDFPEIAREADVLKQRMAALSKRLPRPV
jgi:DNA repair exonuclease SbcCD ATPase subunit